MEVINHIIRRGVESPLVSMTERGTVNFNKASIKMLDHLEIPLRFDIEENKLVFSNSGEYQINNKGMCYVREELQKVSVLSLIGYWEHKSVFILTPLVTYNA